MKYKCMICGRIYDESLIPTLGYVDGCCRVGSLMEIIGYGPMKCDKDEYGDHVQFKTTVNDDPITANDYFDFMHNRSDEDN